MTRCVMVDKPQRHEGLSGDTRLLKALGRLTRLQFGLQARVVRGGTVRQSDPVRLLPAHRTGQLVGKSLI